MLIEGKVLSRIIVIHQDDNALHQIQSGDIFEAMSYRGRLVVCAFVHMIYMNLI